MSIRGTSSAVGRARPVRLRAGLRAALDAIDAPALVLTGRLDVVATNALGRALLAPVLADDRPNLARFLFLAEDASTAFFPEWGRVADEQVHRLRAAAEQDPHDRALHRLVGELSTTSAPFRTRWSSKRLCACHPPRLLVDHPLVGPLELVREDFAPIEDGALTLRICTAGAGSASGERLRILASWTQESAAQENTAPGRAHEEEGKTSD
ncbi:MmyB family transcriptional regulator [Streptomyces acidicola]|uniref:MmyB family transcriptional regulator n=1 Tax=Streptomyces acidicola TaxID=2596892 RepID=UPI00380EAC83